jgi:hypothetical protein
MNSNWYERLLLFWSGKWLSPSWSALQVEIMHSCEPFTSAGTVQVYMVTQQHFLLITAPTLQSNIHEGAQVMASSLFLRKILALALLQRRRTREWLLSHDNLPQVYCMYIDK